MRLDKFLSDMGVGTRSEIRKAVKAGLVTVDGTHAADPAMKVSESSEVTFCNFHVIYEKFAYYMLNKPADVISASDDNREPTVVDLIDGQRRRGLFPVGRLDRDTEGLLLITNDGILAHRLLSPKHHVDKRYYAKIRGIVTESDVAAFREGIVLTDGLECLPADLRILSTGQDPSADDISEVDVVICEGKFHQIKRMFLALGKEVTYLKRISMGPLLLDPELKPGEFRRLTDAELRSLQNLRSGDNNAGIG